MALPPFSVIASTLIAPELLIVRLLTPPLTRMPVAIAELNGVVVVVVVVEATTVPGPSVV